MILIIVTDYVSKSNMYTNGFVHAREKEYIRIILTQKYLC